MEGERQGSHAARGRPRIAVAPLWREEGLAEREGRLGRALVDDLIRELARCPHLEVLAGRTSQALLSGEPDLARLATHLGVTHLLEVAFRASGDRFGVRASLIELPGGRLLLSQDESPPAAELEAASETIAARVANHLTSWMDGARLTRALARPVGDLEAYELWLRGWDLLKRGRPEDEAESERLFERALALDPSFARPLAGLSIRHFGNWSAQHWRAGSESERLAYDFAHRAAQLDELDYLPQIALARMEVYRGEHARARRRLLRVRALAPNSAEALVFGALWWSYLGEPERGVADLEKAIRLNPLHEPWYYNYGLYIHFAARRYEAAVRFGEAASTGGLLDEAAILAAAHAHLGDLPSARRCWLSFLEQYRARFGPAAEPGDATAYVLRVNPFARAEDRALLQAGLESAAGAAVASKPLAGTPDAAGSFRRRGHGWEAVFAGRTAVVPDMKGCRDLAVLLSAPDRRLHCLELAERVREGGGDEVLDPRARRAVQARIEDLQAELAAAERDNDHARTERLGAELDGLIEQLAAALGLSGRARRLGDPAEKARTAVTWRIRSAIRRIAQVHPELGRHLQVSVRTGAFCAYAPERPVLWTVETGGSAPASAPDLAAAS